MRLYVPGTILALMGFCFDPGAALAQAPSTAGSTIRQWFSAAAKENSPAANAPPAQAAPPIHYLRQSTCDIPFTIDPSRSPPQELQLFVSTDQGANWKYFARANPTVGRFSFRASEDGEYWFALRPIYKSQSPADQRNLQPGLRVVIDTRPPKLDFDISVPSDGMLALKWGADDSGLDSNSLRIEYQTDLNGPWQTLSLPKNETPAGRQYAAQHMLRWEHLTAALVRAEIRDRAGNQTVVSRTVAPRVPREGRTAGQQTVPIAILPNAATPDGSVGWPRDNVMPSRTARAPSNPGGELPPPRPSADHPPMSVKNDMLRNPYFSTASTTASNIAGGEPAGVEAVEAGRRELLPSNNPSAPTADSAASASLPVVAPANSRQLPISEPTREPTPAADLGIGSPAGDGHVALPTGDRPRMTNSRQFSLDYEVEAVGAAAVERVELWCTPDGGRSWKRWQEDEDRQSPMEVRLDRDGIFGFRIVVVSSSKLATLTPQPGEPADIWVGVDTTKPSIRLTGAPYGQGDQAGKLCIQWQAFDTGFGDRPIILAFSEQPTGPWNTIAAGLPNSGQYLWAVDPRIPRAIYLRAQAVDDAGNMGEHQVTEPISMAGIFPQGRIRGIRVPSPDRSAANGSAKR